MTTNPPEAPPGPRPEDPGPDRHDEGPRVSWEETRDLGRLRRTRGDRKIAGVAGGLARHLDIDPIIPRVVLVVLVFFGGAGLLLYGVLWLLVPTDEPERAVVNLDERSRTVALLVVGALAALSLVGDAVGGWGPPWPLAVVGVLLILVLLVVRDHEPPPHPAARPGSYPATTPPAGPRHRPGPVLFWYALALIATLTGVLGIADAAGAPVTGSAYPALALAVTAVVLLVGACYGRAGGLILLGLVAALATAGTTAAEEVDAGRIVERPQTAAAVDPSYSLWAGEIVVDLSGIDDVDELDGRTIRAESVFGRVQIVVPEGVDIEVDTTIDGGGESILFGDREDSGADADYDGGLGAPTLTIDAEVTFGQIEVDTPGRTS